MNSCARPPATPPWRTSTGLAAALRPGSMGQPHRRGQLHRAVAAQPTRAAGTALLTSFPAGPADPPVLTAAFLFISPQIRNEKKSITDTGRYRHDRQSSRRLP